VPPFFPEPVQRRDAEHVTGSFSFKNFFDNRVPNRAIA
jgi:hypothetical protein